ncbi:hypothetical protein GTA08_BOTSDO13373 [Neofusicoccum parvum]|uniref:Uncharacterized protein n=1 Tax=Neofusicoccum parvum TaxID=310453 RepID=A0ACB5RPE8_9PEZI|nr:hypothetical protein GTA08_BOTSDO13373 [Neofusicoccum parvum]
MRHTVRYHLRALVRPLKRRVAVKGSPSKGNAPQCAIPCHYQPTAHSRSAYSLIPTDDDALLDDSIELLPPARFPENTFARPSTAPGPSSPSSLRRPAFTSSTTTLDSSFGPSTPSSSSSCTAAAATDDDKRLARRRRRRETWAKSLALDNLFFLEGEDGEEEKKKEDVDKAPRDPLKTKRDSFMWMKFDGYGSSLAWADGARLTGAMVM